MLVDRRSVLRGAAAAVVGIAATSSFVAPAQSHAGARRSAVDSQPGEDSLLVYRKAVDVMRQRSRASGGLDPRGWTYQALIHGIVMRIPKDPFIQFVMFPNTLDTDPAKQLAMACWATCPHRSIDFLAWHRLYIFFFERIAREASGDPNFMLPYWNYSKSVAHAQLPVEFREAVGGSPLNNSLYNYARDPIINGLFSAPAALPASDVALSALQEPNFEPSVSRPGFSAALENTPHDLVHGNLGGGDDLGFPVGDMASTNTAGRDPIFWLHHANIDRLWESWLRAGGETTASYRDRPWYTRKWTFIDETAARRDLSLADLDEILAGNSIEYDQLEHISRSTLQIAASSVPSVMFESDPSISLAPDGNRVAVSKPGPTALDGRTEVSISSARIILDNVTLQRDLSTIFDVYLNLPNANSPDKDRHVGAFNFFGAMHDAHGARFNFDATSLVRQLVGRGTWPTEPSVTILPRGRFVGQPVKVGRIRLIIE